ncbi:MAG: HEAT repeat domain-containing protein, partial [Candidatus Hodarchaeales archaeon]
MTEESVIWDLKDIKNKDPEVKWTAVNNLNKFLNDNPENFRSRMIIKSFLTMINDPHDGIRETIYSTLIHKLHPQQLEGLIKRGLEDSSPSIRSVSLEWLNSANHNTVTTRAVSALQDPSEAVRKIALDIIIARNIKGVEQRLLELLMKEKGGLRRTVIYALGKIQTAEAVGTLTQIMRNPDFDDWTRNQASSALEHLGGKELVVPFIENLADENDYVRETAAAFLKKNENDVTSVILTKAKLDYVALLQHATTVTKQDFSLIIKTLTTQMSDRIHLLTIQLQDQNEFSLSDLTEEWGASIIATRIILNNFLDLRLFPQPEDRFYTEKGLKDILYKKFDEKNSLVLNDIMTVQPFNKMEHAVVKELLSAIENIKCVYKDLYIRNQSFVEISEEFSTSGLLPLQKISTNIKQPLEVVSREFTSALVPNDEGWLNNENRYLTLQYISQKAQEFLSEFHIIDLNHFLTSLGNPNVEFSILRNIVEQHATGRWLDDIQVFITSEEFREIEENSIRIDEDRVNHLISPINMKFPTFLESLQKVLDISTYQSSEG